MEMKRKKAPGIPPGATTNCRANEGRVGLVRTMPSAADNQSPLNPCK